MDYSVVVTRPASRDLEQITAYIAEKLCNAKAASDFLGKFDEHVEGLRKNPRLYGLSRNPRLAEKGLHKMLITGTNYLAVYKVDDETETVAVMRVFYMRRRYENLL